MNSASQAPEKDTPVTNAELCLRAIREMIITGVLLPGQKVHQAELADELQVSRIPLREALSTLAAEGVLTHRQNSGYQVSRFSSSDLEELYLMRRLLETELLRTATLGPEQADLLTEINERIRAIDPAEEPDLHARLNEEFHFALLDSSPLRLVRDDVRRLWYRSSFYRSLYIHEAHTALKVLSEHELIIDAVSRGDLDELIKHSDEHRQGTEQLAVERLGRSRLR